VRGPHQELNMSHRIVLLYPGKSHKLNMMANTVILVLKGYEIF